MDGKRLEKFCDIVVIGAGHAGCEAALAAARLGLETVMFTVSVDSIALMPCNPNIGGSSKGHLVREVDALGGEMGKNIDKTFIQSKMLNQSKGPAVHSLRAQADKQAYSNEMRKTLEHQEHLTIRQGEVTRLLVEDAQIVGVELFFRGGVSLPGGGSLHGNVSESAVYLRGCQRLHGAEWAPGGELSDGFSEGAGCGNVPV